MCAQSGVRSPRRRHPSAHRPRECGGGARSGGQASAESRPEPRAPTSEYECEHGEDGEDATLTVASTTARSPARWAQDPAGCRGRTQQVGGHPIASSAGAERRRTFGRDRRPQGGEGGQLLYLVNLCIPVVCLAKASKPGATTLRPSPRPARDRAGRESTEKTGGLERCVRKWPSECNGLEARCPAVFDGGEVPSASGCDDTCSDAMDDVCDDGGPDSVTELCGFGTDCADCDPR
jgi:hypothetical protein